jgi:hypothetical protein
LKQKESELKTQVNIKEWALFNIGAWLYILAASSINLKYYLNHTDVNRVSFCGKICRASQC